MQILNIKLSIKNGGCNAGNSVGTLISKNINTNFIAKRLLSQSCTKNPISQKKTGLDSFVKDQFFNLIKKTGQIDFLTRNVPDFSLKNYRVKNLRFLMKFKNKYNQRLKINLILLDYIYSLNCNDLFGYIGRVKKNKPLSNKPLSNNSLVQYSYIPEVFLASEFAALEIIKFKAQQKAAKNNKQQTVIKAWENFRNLWAAGKHPDFFECEYDWSWSNEPITITPLKEVLDKPLTDKQIKNVAKNWRSDRRSKEQIHVDRYSAEWGIYLDLALKSKLTYRDLKVLQGYKEKRLIREQKERDQEVEAQRLRMLKNEFWLD
jgi:hypothetical protein